MPVNICASMRPSQNKSTDLTDLVKFISQDFLASLIHLNQVYGSGEQSLEAPQIRNGPFPPFVILDIRPLSAPSSVLKIPNAFLASVPPIIYKRLRSGTLKSISSIVSGGTEARGQFLRACTDSLVILVGDGPSLIAGEARKKSERAHLGEITNGAYQSAITQQDENDSIASKLSLRQNLSSPSSFETLHKQQLYPLRPISIPLTNEAANHGTRHHDTMRYVPRDGLLDNTSVIMMVYDKLFSSGADVAILDGDFCDLLIRYPELCTTGDSPTESIYSLAARKVSSPRMFCDPVDTTDDDDYDGNVDGDATTPCDLDIASDVCLLSLPAKITDYGRNKSTTSTIITIPSPIFKLPDEQDEYSDLSPLSSEFGGSSRATDSPGMDMDCHIVPDINSGMDVTMFDLCDGSDTSSMYHDCLADVGVDPLDNLDESHIHTKGSILGHRPTSVYNPYSGIPSSEEAQLFSPTRKPSRSFSAINQCPIEVIPGLYLGTAENSSDGEVLTNLNIRYIVNVTPDIPNAFESNPIYRYLKIPALDHASQELAPYFQLAIQFISKARARGIGVMVHCVAGLSRSVTVILAYLMSAYSLGLDSAYDIVKRAKYSIAPNFNFMGQLLEFQHQLEADCGRSHRGQLAGHDDEIGYKDTCYMVPPRLSYTQRDRICNDLSNPYCSNYDYDQVGDGNIVSNKTVIVID